MARVRERARRALFFIQLVRLGLRTLTWCVRAIEELFFFGFGAVLLSVGSELLLSLNLGLALREQNCH